MQHVHCEHQGCDCMGGLCAIVLWEVGDPATMYPLLNCMNLGEAPKLSLEQHAINLQVVATTCSSAHIPIFLLPYVLAPSIHDILQLHFGWQGLADGHVSNTCTNVIVGWILICCSQSWAPLLCGRFAIKGKLGGHYGVNTISIIGSMNRSAHIQFQYVQDSCITLGLYSKPSYMQGVLDWCVISRLT